MRCSVDLCPLLLALGHGAGRLHVNELQRGVFGGVAKCANVEVIGKDVRALSYSIFECDTFGKSIATSVAMLK